MAEKMIQCPKLKDPNIKCPKEYSDPNGKLDPNALCSICREPLKNIAPERKYSPQQLAAAIIGALLLAAGLFWALKDKKAAVPNPTILFTVSGSNTVGASMMPALVTRFLEQTMQVQQVEKYQRDKNDILCYGKDAKGVSVGINIKSAGSSSGFRDVKEGKADLIMSSRAASTTESKDLEEIVLCNDALAIIVHPSSTINALDKKRIANIFAGKEQLNGSTTVCARDASSGTWEFFEEKILKPAQQTLAPNSKRFDAHDKLAVAVEQDPFAIGFVSYQEAQKRAQFVKILGVSDGNGSAILQPSKANIKSENYPLTRRLFLYKPKNDVKNAAVLQQFRDFALSDAGQTLCEQAGFFGTISTENPHSFISIAGVDYPAEYENLVKSKEFTTMPYTIRFAFNEARLDTKAEQDALKTIAWFKSDSGKGKTAVLIGFADSLGTDPMNQKLSVDRAEVFRKYLMKHSVPCDAPQGFGRKVPVGNNSTLDGRALNRRVEIWIK